MARKARDYKAEYARSKARAKAAGYQSEREYKAVRKSLKLPRNAAPVPRRILETEKPLAVSRAKVEARHMQRLRRESKRWSDTRSRVPSTKYNPRLTDDQVERYHRAFVEKIDTRTKRGKAEKLRRLRDFMVPDFLGEAEWEGKYPVAT